MEFEFDKEIDAILRKARAGEVAASFDSHLGADEISAFAENALPEGARQLSTAHLADCKRCRKILSDVIALNSEAETETASSIVPAQIVETKTPWYRKFFVFPQIAYAMGALVVLFSGFFGYLVLQNLNSANKSDVSFSANKQSQMEKPATQAAPSVSLNSNKSAANTSALANAPITTGATPVSASNTAANMPTERKSGLPESNAPIVAAQPTPEMDEKKPVATKDEDNILSKPRTENEADKPNAASGAIQESNKTRDKNKKEITDQPNDDEVTAPKLKANRSSVPEPKKQDSEAGKTRNVSGKTFNNVGGIWFDSAYTKQKQKIVNRGTSDYQKLDSGLRSIADQFSGTVVIVWKSKAYRIQ